MKCDIGVSIDTDPSLKTSDFWYALPPERIAQTPAEPRDASRLLVCRPGLAREHRIFRDLPHYLRPGDALVLNETRVLPARLIGMRRGGGAAMELLLLKRRGQSEWEVLMKPGRRAKVGTVWSFGGLLEAEVIGTDSDPGLCLPEGGRLVRFAYEGIFESLLDRLGTMPLPPYIHQRLADGNRYQTVYASQNGSAAAPTAGLHFTPELLDRIRAMGVTVVPVLLHVGLGTFRPVSAERVQEHVMHSEYCEVTDAAARTLNAVRAAGGRIFCVGTTSVRTLETCAAPEGTLRAWKGETDIFITPGYSFRAVDALVTNFHLPESTLLMLVSALMGRQEVLEAYRDAVERAYRFFSFGDAMLIFRA